VVHRVIDIFAGFGVRDGCWNREDETNDGGATRRDTVAGRTFYYSIIAEREREREILAWGWRSRERKRTATGESRTRLGSDACLVSTDGVEVDVSLIRSIPHSHEYLPVNRRAHTHPVTQPHAHDRVRLQATSRISRRYSSCSRKYRQRAHAEVRFQRFPPDSRSVFGVC
jgi:hypothetical protein